MLGPPSAGGSVVERGLLSELPQAARNRHPKRHARPARLASDRILGVPTVERAWIVIREIMAGYLANATAAPEQPLRQQPFPMGFRGAERRPWSKMAGSERQRRTHPTPPPFTMGAMKRGCSQDTPRINRSLLHDTARAVAVPMASHVRSLHDGSPSPERSASSLAIPAPNATAPPAMSAWPRAARTLTSRPTVVQPPPYRCSLGSGRSRNGRGRTEGTQ